MTTVFVIVALGLAVASVVCLRDAYLHGLKKGRNQENWRLRRLYVTQRAACEFELITGYAPPRYLINKSHVLTGRRVE